MDGQGDGGIERHGPHLERASIAHGREGRRRTQLETIYQLERQAANGERLVTIRRAARCRIASARIAYNLTHS